MEVAVAELRHGRSLEIDHFQNLLFVIESLDQLSEAGTTTREVIGGGDRYEPASSELNFLISSAWNFEPNLS